MSGGPFRIHPAALDEAEVALDWYARRSTRAAEMFANELDWAIERISQHPKQYALHEFGTRRIVLKRFPYLVVFWETATGVKIIAVAHGHRRPGYWRDRLE